MRRESLTTVRLHGPLAERFGAEHQFVITTPREAINALDANYPGFRRAFVEHPNYALLVDGDWWRPSPGNEDPGATPVARELDICPMIEGRAFLGALLVSAIIPGISATAASIIGGVLVAALLVGVSLLLSPKAKKTQKEETKKDESYIFSGPENVTQQGVAVPLIYGRPFIGSVVISAGLDVADQFIPNVTSGNWYDNIPPGSFLGARRALPPEQPANAPGRARHWATNA